MSAAQIASVRFPNLLRSIAAITAALVVNIVLSLCLDQIFHMLAVYPPWGVPMTEPGDNLLALSYRVLIGICSGYLAARLAPRAPMAHAITLGAVGTVLSLLGLAAATQLDLGPVWYPALLVLVALPCAWLGGRFFRRA